MKKLTHFLVPVLLFVLIVASIGWYLFSYDREFTRDSLLSQARFQDEHGNSRLSAMFYDAAYSFSGHDKNVAIELANQYKQDGNYTKAELTLTSAIHDNPTPELYTALCKTFVEQDKLLDAVALLANVADPSIKAELDALRPAAPASDFEPGYYSQYMDIHLTSAEAKYIFYTTDGTYPSIAGSLYNGAITLPAGETTVYAIAISESGLVSPVTVLGFTITGIIEEVTFTDAVMEAAIRQQIGADDDDKIYTNQLWEITEFTAPEGVTTFCDLTLMPYLTTLTIHNATIDSLSHLSTLAKLVVLDLTGSKFPVEDMSVLSSLSSLSSLTMSGCSLSTIEGLAGAQYLTYLDLSNNTLRNLDVLTPMTTLNEINLNHNAVTDLSALSSLPNLVKLCVNFNALTSLSPISSCVRLNHLEADNNNISSLSGMEKLPLLSHLSVDYNDLTDVSLLKGNTELTNLSIASNTITDISALSTLTNLKVFDFSSNQIASLPAWPDGCGLTTIDGSYNALTDINSLKNMQQLTHVYMDYNLLTNIDQLANCYCMVQVNVFGNAIPDVSALRDKDIIVNYDPTA
ncbi:MAG: leucine-rich repeat domain-containing protein [Oscillospiraceae bacterium]|nr:leucine-rich repeat domain-containing protein [Oscillospiraceae bacterium]